MSNILVPEKIIIHCSATTDTDDRNWDAIRRYHKETLGWNDIGYHFGIEKVGESYRVLYGRRPYIKGAHCRANGRNHDSLGVCFVGNFDEEPPNEHQWDLGVRLVGSLCIAHQISPTYIYPHNKFEEYKTCPGKKFDMSSFVCYVARHMSRSY